MSNTALDWAAGKSMQIAYILHNNISDCVTSYDLKKLDDMLAYYSGKGCDVKTLKEYRNKNNGK